MREAEAVQELHRFQELIVMVDVKSHVAENGSQIRHGEGSVVVLLQHLVETLPQHRHHHAVVTAELELVDSA